MITTPFILSFGLRTLLTPVLYFARSNLPLMIFLVFLLDILDCNPVVLYFFSKEQREDTGYCCKNPAYELTDKVLDIVQMFIAGWLLRNSGVINETNYILFNYFLLYRCFGIYNYWQTKNPIAFIPFLDFGKEWLLLVWLLDNQVTPVPVILTLGLKFIYEILMHRYHIMLILYKYLFE